MMRETQCMTRETRASRIRFQTEPHEIPKSQNYSLLIALDSLLLLLVMDKRAGELASLHVTF